MFPGPGTYVTWFCLN